MELEIRDGKNALWRKVIQAKYGDLPQHWRFRKFNAKEMSIVCRGMVENSKTANVAKWVGNDSFRWLIGNDKSVLFWEDIWCGNRPLKTEFLRLFRLVKAKKEVVEAFSRKFGFSVLKSLWMISVSASCWSVWLARNEIVFKRTSTSMDTLLFHSKMRSLMWVRAVHEDIQIQASTWWLCPSKCTPSRNKRNETVLHWTPTPSRWAKFNVIGAAKEDEAGTAITTSESETSEVWAIKSALDMYIGIGWHVKTPLI
ncbi:hypothetical protein PVK06_013033 [Gossypium arboreum]|uniref:Reverse transcriptase zinc-binding domain-containing protein n=1 Tax=Gossypium arboreum TaxID=29729 RepID=A0ABR0QDC4_GOSAR|nr:hypothetical protein PVK06_013033 [Gossypium arboreum]